MEKPADAATESGGRTLKQPQDASFKIPMTRYSKEKAKEIEIAHGRCEDLWASREGVPQGAGDASILASSMAFPKVGDLVEARAAIRRWVQNNVPIWIRAIPLEDLGVVTVEDAGLGNSKGGAAQIGNIAAAVDKKIHRGEQANCRILIHKSHKNPRAAPSTMLNEATSMQIQSGWHHGLACTKIYTVTDAKDIRSIV